MPNWKKNVKGEGKKKLFFRISNKSLIGEMK